MGEQHVGRIGVLKTIRRLLKEPLTSEGHSAVCTSDTSDLRNDVVLRGLHGRSINRAGVGVAAR
jgi:hypothetical protein